MKRDSRALGAGIEVGVTLAILAAIWVGTTNSGSPYVPSLWGILVRFRHVWLFSHFSTDAVPSLERLIAGYAIGVAGGVLLGLMSGLSLLVRLATRPLFAFLRNIPPPVLIPPAIVIFGIGGVEKVVIIAFVCLWPVALNTEDGVVGLDPTVLDTARAFGINGPRRIWHVVLPAIGPRIFAGMRFSLSIAVTMLVVAELLASSNGIGFFVLNAEQSFSITDMWTGIVLLGLLGYGLNVLLQMVEKRVLRWHAPTLDADS